MVRVGGRRHHRGRPPGCTAAGPRQRGQDRRVVVADVTGGEPVEHGEHDLHAGRPSKSPMIETCARSPGRVVGERGGASPRSTRRGGHPRARRCTSGTTRGGADRSGWRGCGGACGCGTTGCDRPRGRPVPTRACRRSQDRCTRARRWAAPKRSSPTPLRGRRCRWWRRRPRSSPIHATRSSGTREHPGAPCIRRHPRACS